MMAIGPTNVGGAALNFSVEAYPASYPVKAKENTIGVITTTPISDYIITPVPPAHKEGRLWLSTANPSLVGIQAVKRKNLFIYFSMARQSVSGSWKSLEYKVYQNGKWAKPWASLFDNGNENTALTGGWNVYGGIQRVPGNSLSINSQSSIGWLETANAIDLTDVNAVKAFCSRSPEVGTLEFYVSRISLPNDPGENNVYISNRSLLTIPTESLSGKWYVGAYIAGHGVIEFSNHDSRPAIYLE